jgi:putative glutamine amidotransferase
MLKIGITQRVDFIESYQEKRDSLDQRWASFCATLDAFVIPLANTTDNPSQYCDVLGLDGIIFSGGNNTLERDVFEQKLLDHVIEKKVPVFGVCKGMQLISTYFGSNLIKTDGHVARSHRVTIKANKIGLKEGDKNVNSFHKHGINIVPKEFSGIAYDNNGMCEAIQHNNLPIFCCMWHPERESPFDIEITKILKRFFKR